MSILARAESDYEVYESVIKDNFCWPKPMPSVRMPYFQMTPRYGYYIIMCTSDRMIRRFGVPGTARYLSQDRLNVATLMRSAEMQRKIGKGAASPSDQSSPQAAAPRD